MFSRTAARVASTVSRNRVSLLAGRTASVGNRWHVPPCSYILWLNHWNLTDFSLFDLTF